ncbi:tRNA (mnm(5)s(2)U34)-methyltransferase [Texcoconibacillus texcoconensis]|uniref:16S rRNA C1402 N4-methylase RsmH n=1 Tax=Texcoconibacillus texcoconensis TaxID=1095777 RepID=A0A840QN67_9BACI|nr:class I SAM-dependent methyltransferase [Texcoconibacillus texcoconensis]MBB5172816.1 16S rRNA C1402 N4-methylase RsmH [Texcoconibacillus texcoconensis]
MSLEGILPFARTLLDQSVNNGGVAVDATAGNGHDTAYLANLVGETGRVFSFDVQQQAIDATKQKLLDHSLNERVQLINDGHEKAADYIREAGFDGIDTAVFNLGYLPGSDKTIVTKPHSTITAVEQLFQLLRPGGMIVLVVYHGHEEGKNEKQSLETYVQSFDQSQASVLEYKYVNQKNHPPFIWVIEKRK